MPKKPCFGFDSTGEAIDHVQAILRKYEKQVETPILGAEGALLTQILLNHPRFREKIGRPENIDHHIVRMLNGIHGGFCTKRRDTGRIVDWSYLKAIRGGP